MRFYFNVIEGQTEISDQEGTDLPSEEAAQEEASAIIRELRSEFPGRFVKSSVLEVMSECGRRIIALPILARTASGPCRQGKPEPPAFGKTVPAPERGSI